MERTKLFPRWVRPVEDIMLLPAVRGSRVLAVTSPVPGCGVSTFVRMLGRSLAAAKRQTLIIDLSSEVGRAKDGAYWNPAAGGAGQMIKRDSAGFDLLSAKPDEETRPLYNNPDFLKSALNEDLAQYSSIILDLPPILGGTGKTINPCGAAQSADSLLLMCGKDKVLRSQLQEARESLQNSDVAISAALFNELGMPSIGEEISAALRKHGWIPFSGWAARKIQNMNFLK